MAINKNKKMTEACVKNLEKLGSSCIASRYVKWNNYYRKAWLFLKNLNIELPYDPTTQLLESTKEK